MLPGDTKASLGARVLAREHVLYPLAVGWCVKNLLRVEAGLVTPLAGESQLLG